jgi:hypothetical protein
MFVGIERRRHLVRVADQVAQRLQLANVAFMYGDAVEVDWSMFGAFYLFNPFAEHLGTVRPLDDTIELDPEYFLFYVRFVRERLAAAPLGTRVVTYHGFGTEPPPAYTRVAGVEIGSDELELWVHTGERGQRRAPDPRWSHGAHS